MTIRAIDGASGRALRLLAGLLAAVAVVTFGILVSRYWFVGDDGYISFRYARNLVEGHGPVFNPGERVEGYTSFLWVLLAAGSLAAGLEPELPLNVVGIASGAAILLLLARLGARRSRWGDPLNWIAPAWLAVNRTFTAWSTAGLETQLFSLLLLAAHLAFLREREQPARRVAASALLFGAATLTRPEGLLFAAVAAVLFAYEALVARQRRLNALVGWGGLYAGIVGAHVAWRWSYYGDLLPNTFYAKVSGAWWGQSRVWLGLFVAGHHLAWAAPLLVLAVWRGGHRERLFAAAVGAYSCWLGYAGGDNFEFRFMTPALPYVAWLLQEGVREARHLGRSWRLPPGLGDAVAAGAAVALVAGSFAPNVSGFSGMAHGIIDVERYRAYTESRAEQGRFLRRLVETGRLPSDTVLGVGGAGALPYFSGLPTVDFRGLNDAYVARLPVRERGWIAHEKAAPWAYLTARDVAILDVLNRIAWPAGLPEPEPHAARNDFYEGPLSCVEADGRYLLFATTLDEARFRERFSRLRVVFWGLRSA